jgi:hypothetical protein
MDDRAPPCPFPPCKAGRIKAHTHKYEPPTGGQRQCSCGSRQWVVSVGGGTGVQVSCKRCHQPSRINNMYERGRETGRQEADCEPAGTPAF